MLHNCEADKEENETFSFTLRECENILMRILMNFIDHRVEEAIANMVRLNTILVLSLVTPVNDETEHRLD